MTVADLVDFYLEHLRCKRPDSVRSQASHLTRHLGRHDAEELHGYHLLEYRENRSREAVTGSTVNRELAYLRAAYNLAASLDLVERVPVVRMEREPEGPQDWLSREQLEAVATELDEHADPIGDFARMAFWTGWRKGALAGLSWAEVDWQKRILALPPRLAKNGRPAVFPVEGQVEAILRRRQDRRDYLGVSVPWIFHRGGAPVKAFDRRWYKSLTDAGLPRVRFHCLRASFVLHHIDAGVEETIIRRLCQMSRETFDRYRRLRAEDLRRAVLRAAAL